MRNTRSRRRQLAVTTATSPAPWKTPCRTQSTPAARKQPGCLIAMKSSLCIKLCVDAPHVLDALARDVIGAWQVVENFDGDPSVVSRFAQCAKNWKVVRFTHPGAEQVRIVHVKVLRDRLEAM